MLGCTVTPDRVDKDDRAEERTGRPWCHGAYSGVRTPPACWGWGGHLPRTADIIHQTGGREQGVPPALSLRASRSGRRTLQEKYLESS